MSTQNFTTTYPFFESNQLLTAGDLNDLFTYLDGQIRMTRGRLIGTGIICGLKVKPEQTSKITITPGLGITSDGYIIHLSQEKNYTHYIVNDDKWELFEKKVAGSEPIPILERAFCNRVVQLFCEENGDLNNSSASKCIRSNDVGSQSKSFEIKAYLDLESKEEDNEFSTPWQLLTPINIPRYGYNFSENKFILNTITSFEAYYENYKNVCQELIDTIDTSLKDLEKIKPLIKEEDIQFTKWKRAINNTLKAQPAFHIQYCYDYLKDLVLTYNELVGIACAITHTESCASYKPDAHPKHLNLGSPCPTLNQPNRCVHTFKPAPVFNKRDSNLAIIDFLYQRIKGLTAITTDGNTLANYEVPILTINPAKTNLKEKIQITPSKGKKALLGDRPIPYYLAAALRDKWNFKATQSGRTDNIAQYDETNLRYSIDDQCFFRFEGHVGGDYGDVLQTIQHKLVNFNLPIDIIGIKLGKNPDAGIELEACHFEDLETTFKHLCNQLLCLIREAAWFLYSVKLDDRTGGIQIPAGVSLPENASPTIFNSFNPKPKIDIDSANNIFRNFGALYEYYLPIGKITDDIQEYSFQIDIMDALVNLDKAVTGKTLSEFNSANFLDSFSSLEKLLSPERTGLDPSLNILIKQILLRSFDKLFSSLHQAYEDRKNQLKNELLFHRFATKNSGLEHLAGAPKGGTLILVYTDKLDFSFSTSRTDFANRANPQFLDRRMAALAQPQPSYAQALGQLIIASNTQTVVGDFALPYRYGHCCTCAPTTVVSIQPFIFLAQKEFCQEDEPQEIIVYPSGGQVTIQAPEVEVGTAATSARIGADGATAAVGSDTVIVNDAVVYKNEETGCWFFDPSKAGIGTSVLTYKVPNQRPITVAVSVYEKFKVAMSPQEGSEKNKCEIVDGVLIFKGKSIIFKNDSIAKGQEVKYYWWIKEIDAEKTEVAEAATFEVFFPSTQNDYTLCLEVEGGICVDERRIEHSIILIEEDPSLVLNEAIINKETREPLSLLVEPIGGTFSLTNEKEEQFSDAIQSSILVDLPDQTCPKSGEVAYQLPVENLEIGTYSLAYTIVGKESNVVTFKVIDLSRSSEITRITTSDDSTLSIQLENPNLEQINKDEITWTMEFSDGSPAINLELTNSKDPNTVLFNHPFDSSLSGKEFTISFEILPFGTMNSNSITYPVDPSGDVPADPNDDIRVKPSGDVPVDPNDDIPSNPSGDIPVKPEDSSKTAKDIKSDDVDEPKPKAKSTSDLPKSNLLINWLNKLRGASNTEKQGFDPDFVFMERQEVYQNILEKLTGTSSKNMDLAKKSINKIEKNEVEFEQAIKKLCTTLKQTKKEASRKGYSDLILVVICDFLDKQVRLDTKKIPAVSKAVLLDVIKNLKNANINPSEIFKAWNGAAFQVSVVEAYGKLFDNK